MSQQNLKIALFQFNPGKTEVENFEIAKKGVEKAKDNNTDIILLPELWNIGYTTPDIYGKDDWEKSSLTLTDENFQRYCVLAKDSNIAILFPYLQRKDDHYYNSAALINSKGEVVLNYQKVHTVDKGWEKIFVSGNDFPVVDLEVTGGVVKIGCMICYDREFPEAARILMLNGAEIILVPNACNLDINRLHQFQARGFENMVGVAMTNYSKPKFNGRSVAYNGMRVKGNNDYNPCIALANDEEEIIYAEFDLDALRNYRATEIWGDAYRKPKLYGKLVDDNPQNPFVRKDARR